MIAALLLLQATAAPAPAASPPQDDPVIKCAFDHARQLAASSRDAPDVVADKVVDACAPAEGSDAPEAGFTRSRVRVAATAMVERLRGLDGQPAEAPFRVPVAEARLVIPDEIAPAVVPYIQCLLASAGMPIRENGRELPAAAAKGADCSGQRRLAASRADELLRQRSGKSAEERRELIESTLASADSFVARSMRPPASPKVSNAPNH